MRIAFRHLATLALIAAGLAGPACAQSTWNYAGFANIGGDTFGNSYWQTQAGVKLSVTAYSTTGANAGTGATFATAAIGNYGSGSGFGVKNQLTSGTAATGKEGLNATDPQHSMDNYVNTDMLALNFTNASTSAAVSMVLTQLTTGWHNTSGSTGLTCNGSAANCKDSDISLLRYDGSSAPGAIAGKSIADLLNTGWTLVNSYSDMIDDTGRNTQADTSKGSSWWLISAYNSAWGTCKASASTDCSKLSNGDDFVKVLSSVSALPTTPPQVNVPEPGSIALAGLALLGVCAARRRAVRKAAAAA